MFESSPYIASPIVPTGGLGVTDIAVVILNYNGKNFLQQFLPSVLAHSGEAAVYVADNASTDDSIALLANTFPEVRVIQLLENHGFAQGYNEALAQLEGQFKYDVLLNSDVEVTPNWLGPIRELMEADEQIAACQSKMLDFNQRTHFEYAGAAGGFIDYLGYPFCRGRLFVNLEEDHGQYNDTTEVFWACGACMFVRAEVFHQLDGFDGDFFAHMEELDLCWRMKNAGYKVFTCGESVIYHVGGGTLHKSNPHKTFLNFRNGLALLYKNHPRQDLYLNLLKRLILDGVAGVKFLLFDSPLDCWAVIRAHFNFYLHFWSWRRKRLALLAQRRAITHPEVYAQSIVKQSFLLKKHKFSELNWKPQQEVLETIS